MQITFKHFFRVMALMLIVGALMIGAGTVPVYAQDTTPNGVLDIQGSLDNPGTVILDRDIETSGLMVDKAITLDLNGHSIVGNGEHTITVGRHGKLTLIGAGVVDNKTHGRAAIYIERGGSVTLKGDAVITRSEESGYYDYKEQTTKDGGNSWYVIYNLGSLTIKSGTVESTGNYSSLVYNKGSMEVSGGNMSNGFVVIKNEGELEVTGGTITTTGSQGSGVLNIGKCVISGGQISAGSKSNGSVPVVTTTDGSKDSHTTVSDNAVLIGQKDSEGRTTGFLVGNAGTITKDVFTPAAVINGGTITGDVMANRSASITVNDGVFDGNISVGATAKSFRISGGEFTGSFEVHKDSSDVLIVNSGVFGQSPSRYISEYAPLVGVYKRGSTVETFYAGKYVSSTLSRLERGDYAEILHGEIETKAADGVGVFNRSGTVWINGLEVGRNEIFVAGDGETLQSQIDFAIRDNAKLVLRQDHEENITVRGSLTIDLNGHSLCNKDSDTIRVDNNGNLTLVGKGLVESVVRFKAAIHNEGIVSIDGAHLKFTADYDTAYPVIFNSGSFYMNAGHVSGDTRNGNPAIRNNGVFILTDGRISNSYTAIVTSDAAGASFLKKGGVIEEPSALEA